MYSLSCIVSVGRINANNFHSYQLSCVYLTYILHILTFFHYGYDRTANWGYIALSLLLN